MISLIFSGFCLDLFRLAFGALFSPLRNSEPSLSLSIIFERVDLNYAIPNC